eukprot:CAMPEP_0172314674 /NCGR_PEP_ID=MMETSP1058-20130122/23098_1 /TAXON_ID=83371 /ORGANISM="Detonula confervacea, Strain CCMP 353" /LENGTH=356 /DNA_ID=CAMNT_0013028603 /DNA_START=26 /DNA_END=1096 /DNA_ORIENTATION=+
MNAAVSLSNALLSRRALPNNILRQYNAASSTVTRGRSFSSSGAAASILLSSTTSVHTTNGPLSLSSSERQQPRLTAFPTTTTASQRRSLFIQTATTPNPESLKFVPNGRLVLGHNSETDDTANPDDGEIEIDNESSKNDHDNGPNSENTNGVYLTRKDHTLIARSPLAKSLFNLDAGVKSIYLGYDFLTVTKYAEAHWQHLQTPIFGAIMDFYATGEPVMTDAPQITDTTIMEDDDEIVAMIKELLETRIRPAVQEDGGDIRYVGFEESTGIVTVQLAGSCVGCPSSSVTLKNGVENMLMHYIPEVTNVVSLEEEEDDGDGYEGGGDEVVVEQSTDEKKMNTYQEKLAAAGIPFSD